MGLSRMAHDPHGAWQNFRSGLACYLRVPAALTRHRLWAYQLLPALLSWMFAPTFATVAGTLRSIENVSIPDGYK